MNVDVGIDIFHHIKIHINMQLNLIHDGLTILFADDYYRYSTCCWQTKIVLWFNDFLAHFVQVERIERILDEMGYFSHNRNGSLKLISFMDLWTWNCLEDWKWKVESFTVLLINSGNESFIGVCLLKLGLLYNIFFDRVFRDCVNLVRFISCTELVN